ncbi:hypothetical protein LZ017_21900, partial [Pelomonas sp. CA6]|uniref:hypothetical protein n=1 Tax=Pelomonas sp. CA6 TaxID=2907999 RepID=UPI001F4C0C9A
DGALSVQASGVLQHSGTSVAAGAVQLQGAQLQLQDSRTQGRDLQLTASRGDLRLDRARAAATQGLMLTTSAQLNTEGAQLSGAAVQLDAQEWRHQGGLLAQTDASGMARLTVHGLLDNTGGTIAANA